MLTYYSKPSKDIQREISVMIENDKMLLARRSAKLKTLLRCRDRKNCILCAKKIRGQVFKHRNLDFVTCSTCGHIQTKALPPEDYPGIKFRTVYPKLKASEFLDRKKRIYAPKFEWIKNSFKRVGFSQTKVAKSRWLEIGCGAGYFLSCLEDNGVKNFLGIDADRELLSIANKHIKGGRGRYYNGDLSEIFRLSPSDIYVSFFVLEHINCTHQFLAGMRALPKGTIFIFSVPVFGLSCLLEGDFKNNFARNLDGILHTQLYTDASIKYAMHLAGFKIVSEWVFGEDAADLQRFIMTNLSGNYPAKVIKRLEERLLAIRDPLQAMLDRHFLSDQRHIIAIKR